jgi:hypothetical protein
MKNIFPHLMIALLLFTVSSCSKNSTETGSLVGSWNVVNDSSFNTNKIFTISAGDSGVASSNYVGEQCPADFDVESNGTMVTSFFKCSFAYPSVDSAKYVLAGNQITISIFAQNAGCCSFTYFNPVITRTYTIINLGANTATLGFTGGMSGSATEIINLKR